MAHPPGQDVSTSPPTQDCRPGEVTPMQAALLWESMRDGATGTNLEQVVGSFAETLEPSIMRRAWDGVLARHESLRTAFRLADGGEPTREVRPDLFTPWTEEDWSSLDSSAQEVRLRTFLGNDRRRGLDPKHAPLMRVALLRRSAESWWLVWTVHHALVDGRSMAQVIREVLADYDALRSGRSPARTCAPGFSRFVAALRAADTEAAREFWSREFDGIADPAAMPIPSPGRKADGRGGDHASVARTLPEPDVTPLVRWVEERGLTLNTLVQAAWGWLWSQCLGSKEVLLGITVDLRRGLSLEAQDTVGPFINTLPLRIDAPRDRTVLEWLEEVRGRWKARWPHRHTSIQAIHRWSGAPADRPPFGTLVVFENRPELTLSRAGGEVGTRRRFELIERCGFPLSLSALHAGALHLAIEYDTSCHTAAFAEDLLARLDRVLRSFPDAEQARVADLPILSPEERIALRDRARTGPWQRPFLTVTASFEAMARTRPDAIAIEDGTAKVTYGQLEAASARIARRLIGLGLGPGHRVALAAHRSASMVAGMLGILRSGSSCVPLDPALPEARRIRILEDSRAAALCVAGDPSEALRTFAGPRLRLDPIDGAPESPAVSPLASADAGSEACVIYTSGSTGRPKGVMIDHRALVAYLEPAADDLGLGPDDRLLQFASPAFDVSLEEVFVTLGRGATLVVRPTERIVSTEAFLNDCRKRALTVLDLPTAFWHELMADLDREPRPWPESIRLVLIGGEAALPVALSQWRRRVPASVRLVNAYGPAEAAIAATWAELTVVHADVDRASGLVPIGHPRPGIEAWVLDAWDRPVPPGFPGELHLGGPQLARGYVGRPDLTAERFVRNPFRVGSDSRLYRTGDIVRWLPDGQLQFLGRRDDQLKIRGLRVEPAEIEACLAGHRSVREVAVVARERPSRGWELVAHVVPTEGSDVSPASLRAALREDLPEAMIPDAFVTWDRLPRTASEKIDRRALRESTRTECRAVAPVGSMTTETERALAEIWGELLGHVELGPDSDFFSLGGHSLLLMRMAGQVGRRWGVDIPFDILFRHRTLGALARWLDASDRPASAAVTPSDESLHPASFAQTGLWFVQNLDPEDSSYHLPFGVRLRGTLNVPALREALDLLVERHAALRTSFDLRDLQPMQVVHARVTVTWEFSDLSLVPELERDDRLRRTVSDLLHRPFDLTGAPLFRPMLVRLGPEEHVLVVILHHLVGDGGSADLLLREWAEAYAARLAGRPPSFRPLHTDYARFARRQRERLQGEVLASRLAYWKRRLEGAPPRLEWPHDSMPSDSNRAALPASDPVTRSLEPPTWTALQNLARAEGATPFMVLLAAFGTLLGRLAGTDDVVIGTPVSARDQADLEPIVGLFLATLPLRVRLPEQATFVDLLRTVRDETLESFAHHDLPFEKLVQELRPDRTTETSPLFQVFLNYEPAETNPPPAWPALAIESFAPDLPDPKFELTLYVQAHEGGPRMIALRRPDLFSRERIVAFLDQLAFLLEQVVADPGSTLSRLSLVAPSTRLLLPDPTLPLDATPPPPLPSTFVRIGRAAPNSVAIERSGRRWTYGQLEEASGELARRLRQAGLRDGEVVTVTGDRSFGWIASMIGILRAGGVLLLLDPLLPPARRRFMQSESGARRRIVVGSSEAASNDEDDGGLRCLEVDPDSGWPAGVPACELELPVIRPEAEAYVFFTSGTTGQPKAVVGTHGGLSHFLHWQRTRFGIGPSDRAAQLTGPSFDVVLRDVFTPLISGATLVLVPDPAAVASGRILEWLARERCTILHTVPSLAQAWLQDAPASAVLPTLRCAFFAGEPLGDALVRRWRNQVGSHAILVNLYGPTETTLAKCWFEVPDPPVPGTQPVGRPIPGSQALVLDASLRPCGIGEPGEIVIRTPFRTLGYAGQPEATRRRFVANPFRDDGNDLLYLTGDLGRFRPDGTLDIQGRRDHQVKIRGVRIELGEITALLESDPRVRAAVVIASPADASNPERDLRAFVTADPSSTGLGPELRARLAHHLPAAAVPATVTVIERLPLTTNGKIDREALRSLPVTGHGNPSPANDGGPQGSSPSNETPTPRQSHLARLWAEVLGRPAIGLHDDFFEFGGHSLLALRLISRVNEEFHVRLALRSIFEARTVVEMEALLPTIGSANILPSPAAGLARRRFRGAPGPLPLFEIPGYFGLGYLRPSLAAEVGRLGPYFDGLRYAGVDDDSPPHDTMEAIAAHLVDQIQSIWPPGSGSLCLCGFSFGGTVAFEVARQLAGKGQPVARLLLYDSRLGDGHRARSHAEVIVELLRRARRQPPGRRAAYLLGMVRAKIGSWFHLDPVDRAVRDARLGAENRSDPQDLDRPPELPGDTPSVVGRTGILKEAVRLASGLAAAGYRPGPYDGRVTLFKATRLVANEWVRRELDPLNGWGPYVTRGLETVLVPREHLGIYSEPIHPLVIRRTVEILEEARRETRP